jgi:RNA polymerase-binding transcription factor DksA
MTITEFSGPGLTARDRDNLREALGQRRHGLCAALRMYEEARISPAPRAALARRTRAAIDEIDVALGIIDNVTYGLCTRCRRRLPLHALTLRPLDQLCPTCPTAEEQSGRK